MDHTYPLLILNFERKYLRIQFLIARSANPNLDSTSARFKRQNCSLIVVKNSYIATNFSFNETKNLFPDHLRIGVGYGVIQLLIDDQWKNVQDSSLIKCSLFLAVHQRRDPYIKGETFFSCIHPFDDFWFQTPLGA